MRPLEIEVITLFVDDVAESRAFYLKALEPNIVYEDAASCVLKFGGLLVNLLAASEAPELVEPWPVASASSGSSAIITIKVSGVDAACAKLQRMGVKLLNGPIDRPWGRRTAAFADPSGHVWELAQELS